RGVKRKPLLENGEDVVRQE
ncbi:hypothetical protein A2U01_0112748, partial [Trifolium medium]|nr:hypothetical protein [Trifolium medium]